LVPIPRVVPVILVIAAELPARRVDRDHGVRVKVVARPDVAGPGPRIAGAPVRDVQLVIERSGEPCGRAARAPRLAGPRVVAGLARPRDRVGLPRLLAGLRIVRRDEAANAPLAS